MQLYFRGLAAALLCVSVFQIAGCTKQQEVYLTNLESESLVSEKPTEDLSECLSEKSSEDMSENSDEKLSEVQGTDSSEETEPFAGYVYVCGAVCAPGVYPVYEGMRVFEAIELAGGYTGTADEQWLNLAETVHDGQKLYVYTAEETQQMKAEGVSAANAEDEAGAGEAAQKTLQDGKININTADKDTLMTLSGIGEAKAEAIIQYREEHGTFGSIEEIQNIPGIKTAVFSKIKEQITV